MKYVQKHFSKENLCALRLQVFLCALISQPVCAHTCAQLRGNIDHSTYCLWYYLERIENIDPYMRAYQHTKVSW